MKTILILLFLLVILFLILFIFLLLKRKKKIENQKKSLLQYLGLTKLNKNRELVFPLVKQSSSKLEIINYNPVIIPEDFTQLDLNLISKTFQKKDETYFLVESKKSTFYEQVFKNYDKFKLVFYNDNFEQKKLIDVNFKTNLYEFTCGSDINNEIPIFSVKNQNSISVYGSSGSGKSKLVNSILFSLSKSIEQEFIFAKTKNDYLLNYNTTFINKNNEQEMLEVLEKIKSQILAKQKQLEDENLTDIFQKNEKFTLLVFDECHSYLVNNLKSKEQKEIRQKIIDIIRFILNESRSAGVVSIFITPNPNIQNYDVPIRDSHILFFGRISSPDISKTIFNSDIATRITKRLFVYKDSKSNKIGVIKSFYIQDKEQDK